MNPSKETEAAMKRAAFLDKAGKKYTLELSENEVTVVQAILESEETQVSQIAGLEWLNNRGTKFSDATFSMVTKGSSFEFKNSQYVVEDPTPFETQDPDNGKKLYF